jgi:hypothetical protein
VGGSNPAKTKGLKILSLSRKDKQREGMPIKGHGREFTRRGKKKNKQTAEGRTDEKTKEKKGRKTEEKPKSVIETERNKRTTDREAR